MDGPIFPTVSTPDGDLAVDVLVRRPDDLTLPLHARPAPSPAALSAGTEYRLRVSSIGKWHWEQRPDGSDEPWRLVGMVGQPPDYVAAQTHLIRRNKTAWHITADPYRDLVAGTCDP